MRKILRKMREIQTILILLTIMVLPIVNAADYDNDAVIWMDLSGPDTVTVGDTFEVTVYLDTGDTNCTAWIIRNLYYNENTLFLANITSFTWGDWGFSPFKDYIISNNAGKLNLTQAFDFNGLSGNNSIFTVEFIALKAGLLYLDMSGIQVQENDTDEFDVTWNNIIITINPSLADNSSTSPTVTPPDEEEEKEEEGEQEAEEGSLFDVILELSPDSIYEGENINALITLINVGEPGLVNVSITYTLYESDEVVWVNNDNLAVFGQLTYNKTINTSGLLPGSYAFEVVNNYGDNQTASATKEFTIQSAELIPLFLIILIPVIMIIVILLIAMFKFGWIKIEKTEKNR
jgi:hypothetical protein